MPYTYAVPRLPEPGLVWKNVTVDGKKTAVYCIYRDSRGIMWIGTNRGLYFYDGVAVHPVCRNDLSGIQIHAMASHVRQTLFALKNVGVTPEWVQVGNETTPGMMLPMGSVDNPEQLTALNNAGYDAVKSVCPEAKVIVHLDGGNNQWAYDRMFDILTDNDGKYDMIGMSLYPYWAEQNGETGGWRKVADDCIANIRHLKGKYGKPVMICEIGMPYDQAEPCKQLIEKMMNADIEGIFYWESQASADYNDGYILGCFDNGAPPIALDAFKTK